jgi:hypothetical protein
MVWLYPETQVSSTNKTCRHDITKTKALRELSTCMVTQFGHLKKLKYLIMVGGADGGVVRVMVFNATNNNVLVISWRQVLLVEET